MKEEFKIKREDAERLMLMLQEAHYHAAMNNDNISKSVFINSFVGSGDAVHSVAAALLSTGKKHAPISETREHLQMMLHDTDNFVNFCNHLIKNKGKIPGVGNSFFKNDVDPSFVPVNDFFKQIHNENNLGMTYIDSYADVVNRVIKSRREKDQKEELLVPVEYKYLHPNAALITAAITEFLGGIPNFENWFFIAGRSRAFLEMSSKIE